MRSLHSWIVRRFTYPAWQWRHGGRVLSTLASLEESQWVNPGDLEALQVAKLGALLRHAQARSPYYREVFRRAGFDPREVRSLVQLRDLPVLEKADLRDRVAEIMTTAFGRGLVKRKTSGSTGIPLVLWAEPEARDAWTAAGLRFLRWWGIEIGDRRATLISRHALTPGTRLKQFLLANTLEYSAMDLSAATLARVHARLRRGVSALLGYPSSLAYLAEYIAAEHSGVPPALRAVFTTGEVLHADQRALMRQVFRCPVVDEYGSSETGHVAGECPAGRMHAAAENVLLEALPVDGQPEAGELLVTDLNNFATPLIRYRIGDLGGVEQGCPCGRGLPVLRLYAGRTSDLITLADGRRMDFTVLSGAFEELVDNGLPVAQYRVIQHDLGHFEVLLAGPASLQAAAERVAERVRGALRATVRVTVQTVPVIPPDPTGKRRRFISRVSAAPPEHAGVTQ